MKYEEPNDTRRVKGTGYDSLSQGVTREKDKKRPQGLQNPKSKLKRNK